MTLHWANLLTNKQVIEAFYTTVPPLEGVGLRSVHLERAGPGLVLQIALPVFPDKPLPEWSETGCDRFQCQLQFGGVDDIDWRGWRSGSTADVTLEPEPRRRVRAEIVAAGMELRFTAADDLMVGKPSAYRVTAQGERHSYVSKVDRFRFQDGVPEVWERSFYGRV